MRLTSVATARRRSQDGPYAAVALRSRATLPRLARSMRMDGLVGVLSVGALGWLLTVDPVADAAPGRHAAAILNTVYVTGDLVLVGLTVAVFALHGRRAGRGWGLRLAHATGTVYAVCRSASTGY